MEGNCNDDDERWVYEYKTIVNVGGMLSISILVAALYSANHLYGMAVWEHIEDNKFSKFFIFSLYASEERLLLWGNGLCTFLMCKMHCT